MHAVPDFWATIVSGVIYFVLGGVWYAGVFGKQYQAALNFSPEKQREAKKAFPQALVVHLIAGIIAAYVIGRIVLATQTSAFIDGAVIGVWCWLGFSLTMLLGYLMFERPGKALFWINCG